ncbi:MAG: IclR family transcriptional regulator [Acidobacteriota bacterium]|nr:IclR family transcriptional regulator [Acidobacteriota bacterium]MDH3524299.1 IclR family transcriptional regulator [Acidobacteriota bacterium]
MNAKTAPGGTQAVVRAIRLLKAFTRERPAIGLAELADELGLSRTTAHRLLAALASEGLVGRDAASGGYRLGPAILALGAQALLGHDLRNLAQPELERLAAETGETATLEVLAGDQVLIVGEVAGRHLVTVAPELGTFWPLHATSTGKAILAALPAARRRELIRPPLARYTAATITDPEVLAAELERTAARGFAVAVEELGAGAAAVATALRDPLGEPPAAISLGGPVSRLAGRRLEELAGALHASAAKLSHRIQPALFPPRRQLPGGRSDDA